ncbi:MAG: sugar phosphate isomerase/epimerase [Ruminococcaceae bacterium]|nr:sugar phosphate isomerase/epimerase [Oscillospiraceae bacterium]
MKKSMFCGIYAPRYRMDQAAGKQLLPYVEQTIIYAKNDGCQGVEMLPYGDLYSDHGVEYAKKVRELHEKEGIPCSCYSYGISYFPDPERAIKQMKMSVDIAKELGSPFLHHTFQCSLSMKNLPAEHTIYSNVEKFFVDFGKEIAYYAGEKGLSCIYEDQGFFVNTTERLGELISKIDMPNTGVCLDIGNSLFYEVSPEEFAGVFASIIKHVHVKDYIINEGPACPGKGWDYTISGKWLKNCIPGTGAVNMEKIFGILLSAGYDGFYSLENQDCLVGLTDKYADSEILTSYENMQRAYDNAKASLR